MADEKLDGADVIRQVFGERQRLAHQTGNALPQGVVEAFNVIGFACLLRDGSVPLYRNHTCIGFILVRMKRGLFTVDLRNIGPQLFGHERNDLTGCGVHRDPEPLPVGFLLYKLHSSSASASSRRSTTSVGRFGSRTYK
jgi:hypothetical protein